MTENRYDRRKESDGTWTVFDIFIGMPPLLNEQVGLEMEQADDQPSKPALHPPACSIFCR